MHQLIKLTIGLWLLSSYGVYGTTLPINTTAVTNAANLSKLHLNTTPSDLDSPETALKAAADRGDVDAQVKLGIAYLSGEGGYLDYAEAAKWFKLASVQGNAQAQEQLGRMYAEGQGLITDTVSALVLLTLSAESGRASAIDALNALSIGKPLAQLTQSRKKAHDCKKLNFKGCF